MFLAQTYKDAELVIYNTDIEHPICPNKEILESGRIKFVNSNIDLITKNPYTNIGAIRRDSLNWASGEYYSCWDDDDIFLPWHLEQAISGIGDYDAWKPHTSMFWQFNKEIELAQNVMEASILARINVVKFNEHQGGGEHLDWVTNCKMKVDKDILPSYCFNWSDDGIVRGHKQSGTINREDNFEYHKENTRDAARGPITGCDISSFLERFHHFLQTSLGKNAGDFVLRPEAYFRYLK